MTRAFLIGAMLALLVSGCGKKSADPKPEPGAGASLRVRHVVDGSQGLYAEGSVWHLRVVDASGEAVLDRKLTDESATLDLGAGHYTLESEELPCDGNCGHLDPAADRCSEAFSVEEGNPLLASVTLKPGHGCTIAFDT